MNEQSNERLCETRQVTDKGVQLCQKPAVYFFRWGAKLQHRRPMCQDCADCTNPMQLEPMTESEANP